MTTGQLLILRSGQFACALPILVGLLRYKHLPATGKLFFYFMLFSGFAEWFAYSLSSKKINNLPYLYVFTLIEFGVFAAVLVPRITLFHRWHRHFFYGLLLLMIALLLADIYVHTLYRMNTISRLASCFLIVLMSLTYLLQYLQSENETLITRDYIFWIAAGGATYFAIAFFLIATHSFAVNANLERLLSILSASHHFANLLSYLLFGYALWIAKPAQTK
jgi:hypothetical protein